MSRLRRLVLTDRFLFITCRLLRRRTPLSEKEFECLARVIGERSEGSEPAPRPQHQPRAASGRGASSNLTKSRRVSNRETLHYLLKEERKKKEEEKKKEEGAKRKQPKSVAPSSAFCIRLALDKTG